MIHTPQRTVGFTGHAGSGKTTAANILSVHGWTRYAFADPIRAIIYHTLPPCGQRIIDRFGWQQAKKIPGMRALMQRLGTEAGRHVLGDQVWIDALQQRLNAEQPAYAVIDDVRFANEAHWIRALGGRVIHVSRPGVQPAGDHPSEHLAITPDARIVNSGDPDQLVAEVLRTIPGVVRR